MNENSKKTVIILKKGWVLSIPFVYLPLNFKK